VTNKLAPIKFGTDGWRAVIAREFTFANVERVAQAYADFLTKENKPVFPRPLVVVGSIAVFCPSILRKELLRS
jgi:phosphomannomutase